MTRLFALIAFLLVFTPSPCRSAADDAAELVGRFLTASREEQGPLMSELVARGEEVIPVVLARMGREKFLRKEQWTNPKEPFRHSADILGILVRTERHRTRVIDLVQPWLYSKDANERGWGNRVLTGAGYFPGELEGMPELLSHETVDDVLWALLNRLHDGLANHAEIREIVRKESPWREAVVRVLGQRLQSEDEDVLALTAACLKEIPSAESTAIAVEAVRSRGRSARRFVALLRQRVGFKHPAALTLQQQQAVVGALIELKMQDPAGGDDTLTDVIKDISDTRVLPAFFQMLETHKTDLTVQRQASYCIWVLFTGDLRKEVPKEIYDMKDLNRDPAKSGEAWRRWYQDNKDRLVWDESSRKYRLKESNRE